MVDRIENGFVRPGWPLPAGVRMAVTTRCGGFSKPPFASLNVSDRVGDDPAAVEKNRRHLVQALSLPASPVWLQQQHGCGVFAADAGTGEAIADAAVAFEPGIVCAVTVADCLPVLFCDRRATRIGAAHAGWRGLAAGVLEQTVARLGCPAHELSAWLGPAIGPDAFQVGDEVRDVFIADDKRNELAFLPDNTGRWMADLCQLARVRLQRLGVGRIEGGFYCTYHDRENFYSHRRDARTGRLAALVWLV